METANFFVKTLQGGPYKNEASFKRALVKEMRENFTVAEVFEIESEETEKGFPDLLVINYDSPAVLMELKITDKDGFVTFQKTQPLFYKQHHKLTIPILVWDSQNQKIVILHKEDVVKMKKLRFKLSEIK